MKRSLPGPFLVCASFSFGTGVLSSEHSFLFLCVSDDLLSVSSATPTTYSDVGSLGKLLSVASLMTECVFFG